MLLIDMYVSAAHSEKWTQLKNHFHDDQILFNDTLDMNFEKSLQGLLS